jgi:hypothetical protein
MENDVTPAEAAEIVGVAIKAALLAVGARGDDAERKSMEALQGQRDMLRS